MWGAIQQRISRHTEKPFQAIKCRAIRGRDSHKAFCLSDGKRKFFVKVNHEHAIYQFASEVDGLNDLAKYSDINVPQVVDFGCSGKHSFLILEYLELAPLTPSHWRQLGEAIAQLHLVSEQIKYGWQHDNYLGPTAQCNQWSTSWARFFGQQRIAELLEQVCGQYRLACDIDKVLTQVELVLAHHQPTPSFLHGDFWIGNVGTANGKIYLFDPAPYYGDRECDLAMSELFGRFPEPFYQAYQHHLPVPADYQFRKGIYQLYPLLNHTKLFGKHYVQTLTSVLSSFEQH